MVAEADILDLSSSDEEDEDRSFNQNGSTDSTGLSYLSKACNLHVEDDDVVIIDKPASNDKVKRDKPRVIRTVMDDDDCCMLDTDPGATETTACTPPLDSDELVMTGEKGPVACRDFPHARYQCVHFPFKTTPHANFCTQCHCYVCDSLAPCSLWGDGNSANDHCHASDESRWKTLRKLAKCGPLPARSATPIPIPPPLPAAKVAAAQSAIASLTGIANPMGGSHILQPRMSQAHIPTLLPTTDPSAMGSIPVGLGISPHTVATVKRHPLVIRLRGRGQGRPSQPPLSHHLGVMQSPKPLHQTPSVPAFSGNNDNNRFIPPQRAIPAASSGRTGDPGPLPRHSHFTPYLSPGSRRAGPVTTASYYCQPIPATNTAPCTGTGGAAAAMAPPVNSIANFSHTVTNTSNVATYCPFPSPPLPSSPPPYTPPPPPCTYSHQPPGSPFNYASPGHVYDHYSMRLPVADADSTSVAAGSLVSQFLDSFRYFSASASSEQPVCNVNMSSHSQYEEVQGSAQLSFAVPSPNFGSAGPGCVAQEYRNSNDSFGDAASNGGGSVIPNVDALVGPITEGWVADAAAVFDEFTVGSSDLNQQADTSLEKVLEQMADDDYLWEQFPCW